MRLLFRRRGATRGDRAVTAASPLAFPHNRTAGPNTGGYIRGTRPGSRLRPHGPCRDMSAPYSTKVILAYRSGDVCALPGCGRSLSTESEEGDPINVGQAAHIAGENPTSARYDDGMTDDERDHYNNLIYLCRNCHAIVDAIPQGATEYPVERLRQIKADHEQRVHEAVLNALPNVGFPELQEIIQRFVAMAPAPADGSFLLLPLEEKLARNSLGNHSRVTLTMGLSLSREVHNFVIDMAQADPNFPERLKAGFLEEYYRLKHAGHSADELFDLMCSFTQRGFRKHVQRSAGLAVLVYLFEACEVFEK